MTGMMGAMGMGMNVGITMGVILGILYQGDLYLSTILAMAIGIFAGVVIGIPIHPLAAFEGFLAGIMGGMMGAMLGAMVPVYDGVLFVKVMFLISCCTSILILLLFVNTNKDEEKVSWKWFLRPIMVFIVLFALFIGIEQL